MWHQAAALRRSQRVSAKKCSFSNGHSRLSLFPEEPNNKILKSKSLFTAATQMIWPPCIVPFFKTTMRRELCIPVRVKVGGLAALIDRWMQEAVPLPLLTGILAGR